MALAAFLDPGFECFILLSRRYLSWAEHFSWDFPGIETLRLWGWLDSLRRPAVPAFHWLLPAANESIGISAAKPRYVGGSHRNGWNACCTCKCGRVFLHEYPHQSPIVQATRCQRAPKSS